MENHKIRLPRVAFRYGVIIVFVKVMVNYHTVQTMFQMST